MKHVDKRLLLTLDAVDVDGCHAAGDMVAADGKQAIPQKCPPPSLFLPDRAGSPGCPPGRIPAPCRVC